jgi:hypothetical protein
VTIHLTIWWLIIPAAVVYGTGLFFGLALTMVADDLDWWLRPVLLVWPLALLAALAYGIFCFMIGKD